VSAVVAGLTPLQTSLVCSRSRLRSYHSGYLRLEGLMTV